MLRSESSNLASRQLNRAFTVITTVFQVALLDMNQFYPWLEAHNNGDTESADIIERGFRDEFHSLFETWLATDPFDDETAPANPFKMEGYNTELVDQAR